MPFSASRVSCRHAMSMPRRESSLSMTAVFLISSAHEGSELKPVQRVLTFQLAKRSAGNFFLIFSVGAWVYGLLVELITLSPMHPMGQASHDGTSPYWLGAAQLKAGGRCSVRHGDLSHRLERPLAPSSTPIEQWLITGNCRSTCCVYALRRSWSDLSRIGSRR